MSSRWISIERSNPPAGGDPSPSVNSHALRFAAGLVAMIAIGAGVLMLPFSSRATGPAALIDALFTSVSASTVTGMAVVSTSTHWTFWGQVIILALIQIGGLGFAVGASLLLQVMRRRSSLRDQLLMRDGSPALSLQEAIQLGRRIIIFTVCIEAVGALLLIPRFARDMPLPQAVWFGVFHSISAFSNGGFDLMPGFDSMIAYRESIWIQVVFILLVQAGAIGYVALHDVATHRRWGPLPLDAKLVLSTNGLLLAGGALFFLLIEWQGSLAVIAAAHRPLASLFQSAMSRSAGFATIAWAATDPVTMFVWLGLMFIGGAAGSTAGGIKLATFGVLLAAAATPVTGAREPQAFRRRIPLPLVWQALATVVISAGLFGVLAAILAIVEDGFGDASTPFIRIMFDAMSALGTVGLSSGATPSFSAPAKIVLCLAMMLGRLGPLTLAYALQRRRPPIRYRYPEEPVRIG